MIFMRILLALSLAAPAFAISVPAAPPPPGGVPSENNLGGVGMFCLSQYFLIV
jgi:hypothetical protein